MLKLFFKIWKRSLFSNLILWSIVFITIQPLLDWILNNPISPFKEYLFQSIFTGFLFSLLETTIAFYLINKVIHNYNLSLDDFQFGKPYQKTRNLFIDMPTILFKIDKWNKKAYLKFIIRKMEANSLEIIKGGTIILLQLEYGKLTISSKHRFKYFFLEQGQNIENVELLFKILQT